MKKAAVFTLLALLTFVLYGCGSGDFSNSSGTTISGVASKGPITGGKVAIFSVTTSAHIGKQLATGTTTASGAFSADLGAYTGAIFATMSGSSASYTDESTNTTKTLGATKLHAAAVITAPGPFNLAITPLTELAYQKAASLAPADIAAANALISNLFLAGTDIISTLPANILGTAPAVTDPDKIKYSLALAVFSQLLTTGSVDISGGIALLNSGISGVTLPATWTTAVGALAANTTFTANFQSGLLTDPVSIAFSSPTYSGIINQQITITAHVTKFDGTAVPAGAKVAFTASAGTFDTPTTTDASGNATVHLTPSALGTITVNASATASGITVSTKTAAVVTVVRDPNDIASVTLAPASSSVQVGQTVTLTATAKVVGGANNITPGNPPPVGTAVTFKITSGTGTLGTATTTDASGNATVTVTSGTVGAVTVTATAGTTTPITSSPATVNFTPNPLAPATVTVSAAPASIQADGVTASTITATVTNANVPPAPLSGVPVTFTITSGTGTLSTTSPVTTNASGVATVTLTSTTVGSVTVKASATAVGVTATGTTTVTITALPPRPTKAIVILGTSGTFTFTSGTAIGAINCDLTFPAATKGLTFSTAVLSGVSTSVTPNPSLASNVAIAGDLSLALQANLSGSTTVGFPLGQFVTATFTIPSGTTLPVTGDFAVVAGSEVDNTSAVPQSGINVTILSVTFQ